MRRAALAFTLAIVPAAAAQEEPPQWRVTPSVLLAGYASSGDSRTAPSGGLVEPAPTWSAGASLDASRQWDQTELTSTWLGLAWDPDSAANRGFFFAGRARATSTLSPRWRFTFMDDARVQRHETEGAAEFQRNEASLALEWLSPSGPELGVRLSDRRRGVVGVPELGFARQSLSGLLTLSVGPRTRLRLEAGVQRYATRTADGRRPAASGELAHVHGRGVIALRGLWYGGGGSTQASPEPASGPETPPTPQPTPPSPEPAADTGRYLDAACPEDSAGPELPLDALLLDPISEEDDWDFGQTKTALVVYGSQQLGKRWNLSGSFELQHRDGPNLLSTAEHPPEVAEDRLVLRATLRHRVSTRLTLLLQGSHQRSDVDAPAADFSRTLGSVSIQLGF